MDTMDAPVLALQIAPPSTVTSMEIRVRYLEDQVRQLMDTVSRLAAARDGWSKPMPLETEALASKIWAVCVQEFRSFDFVRTSRRRFAVEVKVRHSAMYVMHHAGINLGHIGRFFERNHSTVLKAIQQMEPWMETDAHLREQVQRIKTMCQS